MVAHTPILKDRYEAIVIGAGLGGLSAAAVLAHEGLDVFVLERAATPGGCCSSFRVNDFIFDAAASSLPGFGEVGYHVLRSLFDFVGQQVDLIPRDSAYTLHFGENQVEFHRDRHAFTAELGAIFPQQAGGILSFMRDLDDIYHAVLDCGGPPRPRSEDTALQRTGLLARHSVSAVRLGKYARMSAEKLLEKHVDDPAVKAFFNADLGFTTGYRLSRLTAAQAALAVIDRHIGGTHQAIGSAQQIPDRLEKSILDAGGRVVYGMPVARVLEEGGRAVGVELEGGGAIAADVVIANTSARALLTRLMPEGFRGGEQEAWAESLARGDSVFGIYLGVPEAAVPEGFNPDTVLVEDPEREPNRFISVTVPSLLDPNLSPEGYHSVTVHAAVDAAGWPSPSDAEHGSEDYEERKRACAAEIMERLRPLAPQIGAEPAVWRLASPATFERRLARESGSWAAAAPADGLVPVSLLGAVTGLRGLFLAGDSTYFGRGVAQAAGSGVNAATAALKYLSIRIPRFGRSTGSFVIETVPVRPQISGQSVVDSVSAVLESHRCMRCEDAPCAAACPASVDIPNMIRRIACSDFAGAASLVREVNPLGEACGLVCPASTLCEAACKRRETDSAVRIAQLEAFACGVCPGPEGWPAPYKGQRRDRIAVIGSGPAGISCALYLSLQGFNVEIFEGGTEAGGLPAYAMTSARLNRQILEREIEGSMTSGVEFRGNTVFGEDIDFESLLREGYRAVFLACGLQSVKAPQVRGTELPGVIDALAFLGAARRKVKREFDPRVAVIGESPLALDTAILVKEMGAESAYLVMQCPLEDSGLLDARVAAAAEAGVIFVPGRKVVEIAGEGRVEALKTRAGPTAPSGEKGPGEVPPVIELGAVILARERVIDPALAGFLSGYLRLGESGLVQVNSQMMTSRHGVFAGGDLVRGPGVIAQACADGRAAALAIADYLGAPTPALGPSPRAGTSAGATGTSFFDRPVAS